MAVKNLDISSSMPVMIGSPRIPMEDSIAGKIAETVLSIPGVVEAHLPQVFIVGAMGQPAQVLVLVVDQIHNPDRVLAGVNKGLQSDVPELEDLYVWLMIETDELLKEIRRTDRQL